MENAAPDLISKSFGVKERTVLSSDEDTVTLSIESAKNCLNNTSVSPEKIDSLLLGTITESELFRGSSNLIMESLTENNNYFSSTVSSAESSGLTALALAYSRLLSGLSSIELVIGTDSFSRYTAPGDFRESYVGSGSASLLLRE